MDQDFVAYHCPHCEQRMLQTVEKIPYVRGFLIAYQIGYKVFIGCCPCVRRKVFGEAGLSLLIGWFSFVSFFINPFLITYAVLRGALVSPNSQKVLRQLEKAGIPDPSQPQIDVVQIGYSLAASMIAADGKILPEEVEVATTLGEKLFEDFDRVAFATAIKDHHNLPSPAELAAVLGEVLNDDGKQLLCRYLEAIASADGDVAPEEQQMLDEVARKMGLN